MSGPGVRIVAKQGNPAHRAGIVWQYTVRIVLLGNWSGVQEQKTEGQVLA